MSKKEQLAEFNVQDIISYIVEDTGIEFDEAMNQFYASETFDRLQDLETGLYLESSAYILICIKTKCERENLCRRKSRSKAIKEESVIREIMETINAEES